MNDGVRRSRGNWGGGRDGGEAAKDKPLEYVIGDLMSEIIAGFEVPDEGRVMADNQPVLNPGRHRLVMFQEAALFPWLDVIGNVMLG